MRRNLFLSRMVLLVLLSLCFVVLVEADSLMWNKSYGGTGSSLIVTADGGYAIAGRIETSGDEEDDFWLVKTDSSGNMMWNRTYGGTNYDSAQSLVETSDGGFAITGYTDSFGAGGDDFWLAKTDASGNMLWNKTYGGTEDDYANSLVATSDGGYAIAGPTESFGAGSRDFCLVKTDEFGYMEWNRTYGGESNDQAYSLVATSDGGYAITGYTASFGAGGADFWLVKTDELGNAEWNRTYGGTKLDFAYSLVATSDGGYAIAGYTNSFGVELNDFWLVKTDAFGNMEWNKTYGGTSSFDCPSLVSTSDGGYAIAGYNRTFLGFFLGEECDACLFKTDEFGNVEWNRLYRGADVDSECSLVVTSDGGYAIAISKSGGFWLIKTDETGHVPEYSSWLLPSLLLVATFVIVVYKKKLLKPHS